MQKSTFRAAIPGSACIFSNNRGNCDKEIEEAAIRYKENVMKKWPLLSGGDTNYSNTHRLLCYVEKLCAELSCP